MFLFVVDLCFVIPPSFCVSLSSLIAVYAVVLCASLFLTSASPKPLLPQDLRQSAADLSSHSSVPYEPLLRLLSGSDFIFTCPKPREQSEELKARLRKLEELAERKEYEELVKDITQRKGTDEPFSSYKDQLRFAISSALFDYGRELWGQISMLVCLATFLIVSQNESFDPYQDILVGPKCKSPKSMMKVSRGLLCSEMEKKGQIADESRHNGFRCAAYAQKQLANTRLRIS